MRAQASQLVSGTTITTNAVVDPNRAKVGPAVSCLKPLLGRRLGQESRQDFAVHFLFRLSKSHQ
jgi:hypothetical protein